MSERAARKILHLALAGRKKKEFTVALSGGRTPKRLFDCLAAKEIRTKFPWKNTHFFWTDERWVPTSSERNNFKHFYDHVGKVVPLKRANMHPMFRSRGNAKQGVRLYEENLKKHFKLKENQLPAFDLIVLGVGEDGHIASLFPGRKELNKKSKLVVAVPKFGIFPEARVSLSLPVLNNARNVMFLLSGKKKAFIAKRLLKSNRARSGDRLPAERIQPRNGNVIWMLDKDAATHVSR